MAAEPLSYYSLRPISLAIESSVLAMLLLELSTDRLLEVGVRR